MPKFWQDELPIKVWLFTCPCKAILAAAILWVFLVGLTWHRLLDNGLRNRMDVEAGALTYSAEDGDARDILKSAKAAGFQFRPTDPTEIEAAAEAKFIEAVQRLSAVDEHKTQFPKIFAGLDKLSRTFSDQPLANRPPFLRRLFLSYYSVDGVHFRKLDDLKQIRQLAWQYVDFRSRGSVPHGFGEIFRPWGLIEFYDPKRAELNDLLPLVFALLMLVVRFVLSYRYYDVSIKRSGRRILISERRNGWVPLWEGHLIEGHEASAERHRVWYALFSLGILAALAIELVTDDPEIWSERIFNIALMACCGPLVVCLLVGLVSLLRSSFSTAFRLRPLSFRGRILLPLVVTLLLGVTPLNILITKFSWDRLITGISPMRVRGYVQITLCAIVETLTFLTLLSLFRGAPAGGAGQAAPDENPPDPGCLARFGIRTDEKMVTAIAIVAAPWIQALKEFF